jgi:hypothetical protein
MILRDENHPSVVIWANGNEGGWEFDNEASYHLYDIQQRTVIYSWLLRNGVDVHHYPSLNYGIAKYHNGNDPFMPTEFCMACMMAAMGPAWRIIGHMYQSSPLHAGGFLWVFSDEAALRTDKEGRVYDSDRDHAPDGILGPYREKGGSFHTIREIWSPIQVKPVVINRDWNGRLFLENKFIYTNLSQCRFEWKVIKTGICKSNRQNTCFRNWWRCCHQPGETALIQIDVGDAWNQQMFFPLLPQTARAKRYIHWTWPIVQTWEKAADYLARNGRY